MELKYLCPKCRALLNVGEHIVLTVKTEDNKRGLVLLSPELGNYNLKFDEESSGLIRGEQVKVHCPVCNDSLEVASVNEKLAKLILRDEERNESEVFFSQVIGERCTYKVKGKKVERYGEQSELYNYWGSDFNF